MNGKLVGSTIMLIGLIAGVAIYYLQVYGYYREVPAAGATDVQLVSLDGASLVSVAHSEFRAIDADSSPIRYRACFATPLGLDEARARFVAAPDALPRNAPGWFDCFDAAAIGAELEAGTMATFLGVKNVAYGVDRVIAISGDGRGYVWHALNNCGTKDYDGTLSGEECPPRPSAANSD